MRRGVWFVVAAMLAVVGCKKTDDVPERGSAAPVKAQPKPRAADVDRIDVLARHLPAAGKEDLDSDPVVVHFQNYTIKQASFDPANLEGATATIELDFTSIKTGSEERDSDLKLPEWIDVSTYPTATIEVANVKKQADSQYTADAKVTFHGIVKTFSIPFTVLATTANSVRIKGEQPFSRLDFGIGSHLSADLEARVATPVVLQFVLTLVK